MSHKHKGNGYDVTAVVAQAVGVCAEKCGCSDDQFRKCAGRFAPMAKTPETASRVFADWYNTKGFVDVKLRMACDHYSEKGKGSAHRSSAVAPASAQIAT